MGAGNRDFAKGLATGATPAVSPANLPPRTGFLRARGNRIAELASGETVVRQNELVDPACCRIWESHNRDYASLNETNCADLIQSLTAQRRQEVAAIVRRVRGDPQIQFEVICGARRHWAVTWMRAHGFSDLKFLVEPRELTDEEAFRVSDLENRSRRDLSDFERARDYARAVNAYYNGSQTRMCERLEVSNAWLSRYLALARLPEEVLQAFGSPHRIKISHAASVGPLLNSPRSRKGLLSEAAALSGEQSERLVSGKPPIPPQVVVRRLVQSARKGPPLAASVRNWEVRAQSGDIIAHGTRPRRGGAISITVPAVKKHTETEILEAIAQIVRALRDSAVTDAKGTNASSDRHVN